MKRKSVIEGSKSGLSSATGAVSPTRRPSVFERLGPGSSSFNTNKSQSRKSGETKHRSHDKSSSSIHNRDSGGSGGFSTTEPTSHHGTTKRIKKKRSRSREKKEPVADIRSKISFRPSEGGGDHKVKETGGHSPSPKKTAQGESRRREPEAKIRSQVAVVTNRQALSNSKTSEKGPGQPAEDWRTDRSHLDFQEEFILEKKRQQLQRELELEMQKERLLKIQHDKVVPEKRVSSSTSTSSSSAASSSSSGSTSSSSSSSSSEGEDNSSSSVSSVICNRSKNKGVKKRSTKIVSSLSGSNSEADIIRTKKGNAEAKFKEDVHIVKMKSIREERETRRDPPNVVAQDKSKKSNVPSHDVSAKAKHSSGVSSSLQTNTGTPSISSAGKHKISHHSIADQAKGSEKAKKVATSIPIPHKDVLSNEILRTREHSSSPSVIPSVSKQIATKSTNPVKRKQPVDSANASVRNKAKEVKSISQHKASLSTAIDNAEKMKHRMTAVDIARSKSKPDSPKPEVVRGRRTPPHAPPRAPESHAPSNKSVAREKRLVRHPRSPPPLPPPAPRTSDLDKPKVNRDRRQLSTSESVPKLLSDSIKKSVKDQKERKLEAVHSDKNVTRGREDSKDSYSTHQLDSHHVHSKGEADRGREGSSRLRLTEFESHSVDRGRINEPRGPHSPPRRDRSEGKKSERSSTGSHQLSRDGIIDRLRDLSRTSVELAGEYRGRRENAGRAPLEMPPEPRGPPEDRMERGNVDRDRRGRMIPEEPRYGTPGISDHRRRPLTPPPAKYHGRNVTPPPRPASPAPPPPPPRHWSRDHPDPRDSDIPFSSDRRKTASPLPHGHYDMRNYGDVDMYDYGRSDHRNRDHHSQRRDNYHTYPPEPLDMYDRNVVPRNRQDFGHGDQRRDDYLHANRWENPRDDRLKVAPELDRLRENERWHDDNLTGKRKRGRDEPQEKLPLPKRRRGLTPPVGDNPRGSRTSASNDSGRPSDSHGRKRLSCESTSSSSRGNTIRVASTSEVARSSKERNASQSTHSKESDRNKRHSDVGKDVASDNRGSRTEENKRKRPRTPDGGDKHSKSRKLSPSQTVSKEVKQVEKVVKDVKPEKTAIDKDNLQVTNQKEETKINQDDVIRPTTPVTQNAESFSDWTDDSMDLLNQEENVETTEVKSVEKNETVTPADTGVALSIDTNKDAVAVIKTEKPVLPSSEKKKEETVLVASQEDKGRRKPKSEGGDDSRGSFEDGGVRERKSRDRIRDDRSSVKSFKPTSRHGSLERSIRRRHHDQDSDRARSKAATPISRPRTPVSRPRTPVSRPRTPVSPPRTVVSEPINVDNAKKQQSKTADNLIACAVDSVVAQTAVPDEKYPVTFDDDEYDPISDGELDGIMDESDEKEGENDAVAKPASTNTLDVDWASLVRDNYKSQPPADVNKQSVLKKFTPANVLYRIGVSAKHAGPEMMERIQKLIAEERPALVEIGNDQLKDSADHSVGGTDVEPAKFDFEDEMAAFHSVAIAQKKERETILDDIGSYRQALCARKDLQIRRKLCRLKLKESSAFSFHNIDLDMFKLSLQLFQQRRKSVSIS